MRALVKCISLFGLGIGLYLGDLKHVVQHTDFEKAQQFINAGDYMALHEFIKGLSEKDQVELFNAAPMGTKTDFKNAHRATMKQAEEFLDSVVDAIGEAVQNDDSVLMAETIDELSTYERTAVWARLTPPQQEAVKQLRTQQEVSA
jgi:Mg/Co/Ni transporter MgtE